MPLNRRDFLKLAGVAGLTVSAPFPFMRNGRADENAPYDGPLFLLVNAGGGWDPTSLCDPKGRKDENAERPVNNYFIDEIGEVGNFRHAPVPGHAEFFTRHRDNLLVVNGVDTATNGHDSGSRNTWSGNLAEGHPSIGAIIAAIHAPDKAMGYITNGGYDITRDIVARTRVGDVGALERLAFPNKINTFNEDVYHTEGGFERIQRFQRERLSRQREHAHLPHEHLASSTLHVARGSNNELKRLTEFLPDIEGSQLKRQAQVAIAAYKAGLCVSANLSVGGFDTHGDHDNRQFTSLANLLSGVNDIWDEAERQNMADRVVVLIGSDFGRTPYYNANRGKDHWSITSFMLMGAGIPGNTVIGASDEGHNPLTVNPETLELDEAGVRITPAHIHQQIRKLAGVDEIGRASCRERV